ncbi:S8 family serine peptidase [Alteromonas pelagimontana]|uniref:S8 family serine peptidase n=1 Tax=Alteromonas pelagimontana TaxID=1858656 RepID=A0A6M4MF61_9ALTE|nr:S8 family serine peptidase [Alteromonas pelagimontana]QJR81508.1 S8 family serine peptidase [Alteromonas pelagimontana]
MLKQHTLNRKLLIATTLTLLSASVNAAVTQNAPVEVPGEKVDLRTLLQERLNNRIAPAAEEQRYIVKFKNTATSVAKGKATVTQADDGKQRFDKAAAKALIERVGGKTHKVLNKQGMVAASMTKGQLNKLRKNSNIESISPDPKRSLMAQTTPYGYNMVQANQLAQSDTSARKVCVIDTGYNLGHPDLPDSNNGVTGIGNNSGVGNWYNDGNGHGTHVAGTISAYDNNEGVIGVYPGVNLHIVKIFDDNGDWTYASDLIAAINQCQDAGANVVNMSLGGGSSSSAEQTAMENFEDDGILLVAAAGNDGNSTMSYPASYDAVMSVAAVDSNENHASYSQYNSKVEIAAPGSSVYSTYPTNTYASLSGTSMATPHVVGAAALVWSFFPQCTNTEIRSALTATAKDRGAAGRDNQYGFGIVKASNAVDYLNTNGCDGGGSGGENPTDPDVEPVSGQVTDLSGARSSWKRYTWDIPAGVSSMTIQTSGGTGDVDLYVKLGSQPETNSYDCRPYLEGNGEVCTFNNPASGTWHIGLRAYSAYNGVTLSYSYE